VDRVRNDGKERVKGKGRKGKKEKRKKEETGR